VPEKTEDDRSRIDLTVRMLHAADPPVMSAAFASIGWDKPAARFVQYLAEQSAGDRVVLVAELTGRIAGYLTLCWTSSYAPFRDDGIPEIEDLNVLPHAQRQGVGTRLLREAEGLARPQSAIVGIAVGLHGDYGPAQRLYVKSGFVPDGRGAAYNGRAVDPFTVVTLDDHLTLSLTKSLA
jgi:GNAT superfamily N-acetyltransferase